MCMPSLRHTHKNTNVNVMKSTSSCDYDSVHQLCYCPPGASGRADRTTGPRNVEVWKRIIILKKDRNCGWMEVNKTVCNNMGCHSEHTVILHKHLKGAEQVCKLVIVPMCQRSSLHPRHCKRCQLSWSAGEMLQCLVVISVSHCQNKHSKISSSQKFPQVCCQPRPCFVQTVCTVGCRRIRWNYICLNPQFKRLLWCTSLWIPVNQVKPLHTTDFLKLLNQ